MLRCSPRPAVTALALLLLSLAAGAAPRTDLRLYPGARLHPSTEHVYTYPLPEALAAARALLEAHDLDVEPYAAPDGGAQGAQMITAWRVLGRVQQPGAPGSARGGFNRLRRYYVQGQALGPGHSVVRIFRIDREEAFTGKDNASAAVARANQSSQLEGRVLLQWREFEQAAEAARRQTAMPDLTGRMQNKVMADSRIEEDARVNERPGAAPERRLTQDPRFVTQHRLPDGDELRGRSDPGVRDLELERELVQRLEQFASLEFTGGGVDPAPPPAPPRAPPHTLRWEQEQGGVPFTSPGVEGAPPLACGEPVQGLEPLVKPGLALLVGEQLGTREVPALVGHLACQLAQRQRPVLLGLPLPREEQRALEAYLRSLGTREDQDVLLSGDFWRQVPRDGRSSRALLVLIERVRRWRQEGRPIEPFAYDARQLRGNAREQQAAETVLARARARPDATLLVLGGNEHVRLKDGASWNAALQPLGSRLVRAGLQTISLDTAFERGERWACAAVSSAREAVCRIYATAPTEANHSPRNRAPAVQLFEGLSREGFTGLLHVGPLTPALPALLPQAGTGPAPVHSVPAEAAANVPASPGAAAPALLGSPALPELPELGDASVQAAMPPAAPGAALPPEVGADGEEAPLAAGPARAPSPALCGEALFGAQPLMQRAGLVLLGEVPGSHEIPGVAGQLVCEAAARGLPVTLALELPRREQRRVNRFLASTDAAAARALLVQGEFWQRTHQDGRSSIAMLALLERVRRERHAGLSIEVLAFDTFAQGTAHEALMAQALLAERARQPERLMVVLTGNVHARSVKGTAWDPELLPLGYLLRQREPRLVSLDVDHGGGAISGCKLAPDGKPQCGAFREVAPLTLRRQFLKGPSVERPFLGHKPFVQLGTARSAEGFDGLYYVGRLSPAGPAVATVPARPPEG